MSSIGKQKFFNTYLPIILAGVILLAAGFAYEVFSYNQNKAVSSNSPQGHSLLPSIAQIFGASTGTTAQLAEPTKNSASQQQGGAGDPLVRGGVLARGGTVMGNSGSGGGTPALNQFFGKDGISVAVSGATTGANGVLFTLDPTGYTHAVTAGSLILMSGEWPDAPTVGNGYPHNCTSHCLPTFTDNGSGNTWNAVFTPGSCQDSNGIDHGFYYSQNVSAGTNVVTETHPDKISNTYWNISNWYNVATAGVVATSSCATGITPSNNTAPNISGTPITTTGTNNLIYVEVDDNSNGIDSWTSVTVPAGCTLLDDNIYIGHVEFYCIQASAGSFTPQFTIAQSSHDTFTIMAVAFKAGSGGSAPSAGVAVLLAAQNLMGSTAATTTVNVACPVTTTTLVVTDDANNITAVSDSNAGDIFTDIVDPSESGTWYKTGISIANPNTFTVTATTDGNGNDLLSFYCTTATGLDSGVTAGGGDTLIGSSSVANAVSTGAGGTAATFTNLPTLTPSLSNDLFIINGVAGSGPYLACTQPSGCVDDFPSPTLVNACSVTTAGVCGGDVDMYTNGDIAGHFWQSGTAQINFGWSVQKNSSYDAVMVTAFH